MWAYVYLYMHIYIDTYTYILDKILTWAGPGPGPGPWAGLRAWVPAGNQTAGRHSHTHGMTQGCGFR